MEAHLSLFISSHTGLKWLTIVTAREGGGSVNKQFYSLREADGCWSTVALGRTMVHDIFIVFPSSPSIRDMFSYLSRMRNALAISPVTKPYTKQAISTFFKR